LLEGEHALDVVAVDLLAGDGVDDRGLDAEEGEGGGSGLGRGDSGERCDDVGAGFGLPVGLGELLVFVSFADCCFGLDTYVDNVSVLLANDLVVPFPHLGGNGLADRSKNSQVLHVMLDVLITGALQ
jgi:hypothetical protein